MRPPLRVRALLGFCCFNRPLSAQAQTPSRPSGDAKEQEPSENEGSAGRGRFGPPGRCAEIATARRHCYTLVTAQRSRIKVNSALNRVEPTPLVAEAATAAQDIWGAAMDRNIPEIAIRYGA